MMSRTDWASQRGISIVAVDRRTSSGGSRRSGSLEMPRRAQPARAALIRSSDRSAAAGLPSSRSTKTATLPGSAISMPPSRNSARLMTFAGSNTYRFSNAFTGSTISADGTAIKLTASASCRRARPARSASRARPSRTAIA